MKFSRIKNINNYQKKIIMKTNLLILVATQFVVLNSWGSNFYVSTSGINDGSKSSRTEMEAYLNVNHGFYSVSPKELSVSEADGYSGITTLNGSQEITMKEAATTTTSVIPTFYQLGPYFEGCIPDNLPNVSLNGVQGSWYPPAIITTTAGSSVYTFTPNSPTASSTTMTIKTKPVVTQVGFTQDIGTTLLAYWPLVPSAIEYVFQCRPYGSSAPWVGIGSVQNSVKVGNLTPGLHYECRIKAFKRGGYPIPGDQTGDFTPTAFPYTKDNDMGTTVRINWPDCSSWSTSFTFQYKNLFLGSAWKGLSTVDPNFKIATSPDSSYICQVRVYIDGYYWGTTQIGAFKTDPYVSSVSNNAGTSLNLTWTNMNNGDPTPWVVDQYLRYRVKNSMDNFTQKYYCGGTNTAHLTGLTPNTEYEFLVKVYLPNYWGTTPTRYFTTGDAVNPSSFITDNTVNIYPNPFVNRLSLDLFTDHETNLDWKIFDMTGKEVMSGKENMSGGYKTLSIDAENLPKGVFVLSTIMDEQIKSYRIMKI